MKPSSISPSAALFALAVRHETQSTAALPSWVRVATLAGSVLITAMLLTPPSESESAAPLNAGRAIAQAVPARTASEWLSLPR